MVFIGAVRRLDVLTDGGGCFRTAATWNVMKYFNCEGLVVERDHPAVNLPPAARRVIHWPNGWQNIIPFVLTRQEAY